MLDLLQKVVSSDAFVQIVVAVVAAVWALPRLSQWREELKSSRWWRLEQLAENAVLQTWNAYTAQLKVGRQEGKLSAEEAAQARKSAVLALRELAADELPDVLQTYGQEALEALVGLVHGRLQKEGVIE